MLLDHLIAVQAFIVFATTLSSTTLIAYRIHVVSTRDIPGNSKRLLKHILEILVQSAAAYSLVAIAQAISGVVPQPANQGAWWASLALYTSLMFNFVSVGAAIKFLCVL